jgi:hypothetical protein
MRQDESDMEASQRLERSTLLACLLRPRTSETQTSRVGPPPCVRKHAAPHE